LPEHDTDITIAVFSPSGQTFITGVESGKIYVWNILDSSVKLHRTLTGHTASVKDICFSKSGRFMVTCGDLSARVWDVENGYDQRGVYYAPINCVVFKTEQEILAGDAVGKLNNICC
jgi:WD40 repeat protein